MQCPNCKKEAINVNGRYVCLDCGVEITPDTADGALSAPSPGVTNHGTDQTVPQPPEQTPDVTLPETPEVTPSQKTVQDAYIKDLNSSAAGVNEFAPGTKTESSGPLPDFPGAKTDGPKAENPDANVPPSTPENVAATPEPAPVPDPAFSAFSAQDDAKDKEVKEETTETQVPDSNPAAAETDEPKASEEPGSDNYFQPSSMDIGPGTEPQSVPETPEPATEDLEQPGTQPRVDTPGEVEIPVTNTQPPPPPDTVSGEMPPEVTPPVAPENGDPVPDAAPPEEQNEPPKELFETQSQSLDNLLGKAPVEPAEPQAQTSAFDGVTPPTSKTTPEAPTEPAPSGGMPGSGNIPPADSVFGPQENPPQEPVSQSESPKPGTKKWLLIGGIALGAILLLSGIIYLGYLFVPKTKSDSNLTAQNEMFKYSDLVGKAMDPDQSTTVNYEQNLDYSKATVAENDGTNTQSAGTLAQLFAAPVTQKGAWQTDKSGNISLNATLTSVAEKRIYIKGDKATYVFAADAGTWNKADGLELDFISPLYPAQNKGSLFYTSKDDAISYVGDENISGTTYRKIKINPKREVFEALITASNAALAKAKFTEVNTGNVEILAWITDDGKIYKVTAGGDLGVKSDLFEGTVTISATATYDYKEVKISRP